MASSHPITVPSPVAGITATTPKYQLNVKVVLSRSGSDDDSPNDGKSEIIGHLVTTVRGEASRTTQINRTVLDNQNFPNGGTVFASDSKVSFFIPATFSVLFRRGMPALTLVRLSLRREFDLSTTEIDWASGKFFQTPGLNGGYRTALEFQVRRIV